LAATFVVCRLTGKEHEAGCGSLPDVLPALLRSQESRKIGYY
jgi:hypothetical protein